MKKVFSVFLFALCGVVFLTCALGSTEKDEEAPKEVTYEKISVDTLENELEKNAAAAKDKYNGKYLEISGKLGTIDSDLSYISLDSRTKKWDLNGIHCSLKNEDVRNTVRKLNKEQKITVRGKITDVGEVFGYYLDAYEILAK